MPAGAAARKKMEKEKAGPGPVRNITDPDARLMPVRGGGFIEGYNTQNVSSQDELVIATELTQDTTDAAWFEPMLRQAEDAAAFITSRRPAAQDQPARSDHGQAPGVSAASTSRSCILCDGSRSPALADRMDSAPRGAVCPNGGGRPSISLPS